MGEIQKSCYHRRFHEQIELGPTFDHKRQRRFFRMVRLVASTPELTHEPALIAIIDTDRIRRRGAASCKGGGAEYFG